MKKIYLFVLYLAMSFTIQTATATNPISIQSYDGIVKKNDSKKGFVKKVKHWFKNAADKSKIHQIAKFALIFGCIAFFGMILAITVIGAGAIYLLIATLALAADILAIFVLVKTGKERKGHKKARKKAVWGLVLGLLAGLTPLALLFLVLSII